MNIIGMFINTIVFALIIGLLIFAAIKFKSKISYKRVSLVLLIQFLTTLIPSCFEPTQKLMENGSELMLGFPFDFYMVKQTVSDTFAVHFNIIGFLANFIVIYLVASFFVWVINKIKGVSK